MPSAVSCFFCWFYDKAYGTHINTTTRGKAKAILLREIADVLPELKYTEIRVTKAGAPRTSEHFIRNAIYRGLPDARCGDRVVVDGGQGTIVGHNASANFNVLFDEDHPHYPGMRLNVHPQDVQFLEKEVCTT